MLVKLPYPISLRQPAGNSSSSAGEASNTPNNVTCTKSVHTAEGTNFNDSEKGIFIPLDTVDL